MHPLSRLNHQPHNPSSLVCLDLICFKFILLSIPGRYAECRDLGSARNDPPECLSTIPSLHVTTPSVVVGGVEFVRKTLRKTLCEYCGRTSGGMSTKVIGNVQGRL